MDHCQTNPAHTIPVNPCDLMLPQSGRFWLKWVRLDAGPPGADHAQDTPGPVDIRIEGGVIRAVLPAGQAPCCAPGLVLKDVRLTPVRADDCARSGCPDLGAPASFVVRWAGGASRIMIKGAWALPLA